MKILGHLLMSWVALLLLIALAVASALVLAVQREPTVAMTEPPTHEDVARAVALLRLREPRAAGSGAAGVIELTARDVDVGLGELARRFPGSSARVDIAQGSAVLRASVHLPISLLGHWLNVEVRSQEGRELPAIESVRIGRLALPVPLALAIARRILHQQGVDDEVNVALAVVRHVSLRPGRAIVQYALQVDTGQRMAAALVPLQDQLRLRAYWERLAELTQALPAAQSTSMAGLVGPLFELARQRSASADDAVLENRALLLVLTLFANGRDFDQALPAARQWRRPRPLKLTLVGRDDFPLHLLISAAIAAQVSGPLSQAVGVYKEVADAHGGSGFSFNDIAADRAGTRLGERANQAPRELQSRMAKGVTDSDLLPQVSDLPEFMTQADFDRRYGGVGAPAYNTMLAEIDRRVAALPALR